MGRNTTTNYGSAFPCPCGHDNAATVDSRLGMGGTRRRKVCTTCGLRFTTLEVTVNEGKRLQALGVHARRAHALLIETALSMEPLLDLGHEPDAPLPRLGAPE